MNSDDFSWLQRVNVALELAHLLEFLHRQEQPYVVLNLDPQHIMLDHAGSCVYSIPGHETSF